jgi:hypothetical protein
VEEVTEVGWCAGASGGRRATVCGGGRGPRPVTSCAMVLSLALAVEGRKGFGTGKSLVIAFGPRKVLERFQISQKKQGDALRSKCQSLKPRPLVFGHHEHTVSKDSKEHVASKL